MSTNQLTYEGHGQTVDKLLAFDRWCVRFGFNLILLRPATLDFAIQCNDDNIAPIAGAARGYGFNNAKLTTIAKPTPLPSTLMERAMDVLRAQYEYQWFSFEPNPLMYKDLLNAKLVPVKLVPVKFDPLKQIRGYFERTAKVDYANGTLSVAFTRSGIGGADQVRKALDLFGRPKDLATIQISWSEP